MKVILARKLGMTQIFRDDGRVLAVTIFEAGPVVVTQKRTKEKDGYEAIQVGFSTKNPKNLSKSVAPVQSLDCSGLVPSAARTR